MFEIVPEIYAVVLISVMVIFYLWIRKFDD